MEHRSGCYVQRTRKVMHSKDGVSNRTKCYKMYSVYGVRCAWV